MSCENSDDTTNVQNENSVEKHFVTIEQIKQIVENRPFQDFLSKFKNNEILRVNNVIEDLTISDFTETSTLYHPNEVNKKIKSTLLKQTISRDLSKPMRRYDSEIDYIPTQFICEFIKVFTNVQGIKFRSSLHNVGNNIVIFNQNIMNCNSVKKVKISSVNIKSLNI